MGTSPSLNGGRPWGRGSLSEAPWTPGLSSLPGNWSTCEPPRGPAGDALWGTQVHSCRLSALGTGGSRGREGLEDVGRGRQTQRMKTEKPKHACRATPCQWSAKEEGWLRALLTFIYPSSPEQLSTNSGQPRQDTPCKLSLPRPS